MATVIESTFFWGKPGVGKTYEAKAILSKLATENRKYVSENPGIQHRPASEMFRLYKCDMLIAQARVPKLALDMLNQAIQTHVIVLDDLGASRGSDWSPDIIRMIVDERLDKGLATIVTSNLSVAEIAEQIDNRLADRLNSYEVIKLEGKSWRV